MPHLDESKDMEVDLKQFVCCPSFSPTCFCSFVVLYGGGVAAGQELHWAHCGDCSVAAAAAAALMRMRSAIPHECNIAHPAPPRSAPLVRHAACFFDARRVWRLLRRGTQGWPPQVPRDICTAALLAARETNLRRARFAAERSGAGEGRETAAELSRAQCRYVPPRTQR
jgi:hypothetical protein